MAPVTDDYPGTLCLAPVTDDYPGTLCWLVVCGDRDRPHPLIHLPP